MKKISLLCHTLVILTFSQEFHMELRAWGLSTGLHLMDASEPNVMQVGPVRKENPWGFGSRTSASIEAMFYFFSSDNLLESVPKKLVIHVDTVSGKKKNAGSSRNHNVDDNFGGIHPINRDPG